MGVYPGTVITWIPPDVADGIRVVGWAGYVVAITWMAHNSVRYRAELTIVLGRTALMLYMIQQCILQLERWHQPLTYEGLPALAALVVVFVMMFHQRRQYRLLA
jgi:hypothetical protein